MTAEIIVIALCVAAVVGTGVPAPKYPAGVNPHACPNYPYCDNVLLAAHTTGHHGAVAPNAAPVYTGHPGVAFHGVNYPAGVSPHLCPNYPYCGPTPVQHAVAHHGGLAGEHGEDHDDGSYRPWEYETPYQHQYDDGQYHHGDHRHH